MVKYARIKGSTLMGTGDFTHPEWIKELKRDLVEEKDGIYYTKDKFAFALTSEISLIYTWKGKGRRIHNIVWAPNFDVVQQITEYLLKHGRIDYDGRPIFKIPCPEFTDELTKISKDIEIIPAHIWTPHFSLFGDYNQFSTVEECFEDQTKNIHALETGLSSDPPMNWMLSQLDKYNLVSFSDSHSFWPWRMAREATIFDMDLTYKNLINAIRTGKGLSATVEVDPNFGKYHYTGHRNCNISLEPKEALKFNNICPKCGTKLVVGVLERVQQLADRPFGFKPKNAKPFYSLIPLSEILSALFGKAVSSPVVWKEFYNLVSHGRTEFDILINLPESEIRKLTSEKIANVIMLNREGKIKIKPGYDGVYGVPLLNGEQPEENKIEVKHQQKGIKDFI